MSELWNTLFSDAALSIRPSPIREMLHMVRRPGMISFAGGMPDPEIFPVENFAASAEILRTQGKDVLQYGTTEGYPPLKEFLRQWTAPRMGRQVEDNEILITAGSSQVVDLLSSALLNRGDCVIIEEPTFLGTMLNMYNHGADFICIPCDAGGMRVDLLPEKIEEARRQGKKIKFIYTIVNFHNPLGCTMSLERRKALLEVAHRYRIPVLEDDPYGYVRFDGEDLPSLFSMDKENMVVYAGSFSKILAPGTRVGWCTGPAEILRKMAIFKQGVDVCASVVAQAVVYEYCRRGHLDSFLPKIIAHYRKKRDDMEAAFRRHLPMEEVSPWVTPEGGFFYWLETPRIEARPLFEKAIERCVAFVLGEAFYPKGGGTHNFRMCYTFASSEQTEEGCKRLGEAMRSML